jgi:sugar/nucleoside kinase (ribokinase family)
LTELAGTDDLATALHATAPLVRGFIGVTASERGFYWRDDARIRHMPAPAVKAVDTLAAGDVFHGAFALALAEGRTPAEAGRFACVAASLKCRSFGGRLGTPDRTEVDAFLAASNHV